MKPLVISTPISDIQPWGRAPAAPVTNWAAMIRPSASKTPALVTSETSAFSTNSTPPFFNAFKTFARAASPKSLSTRPRSISRTLASPFAACFIAMASSAPATPPPITAISGEAAVLRNASHLLANAPKGLAGIPCSGKPLRSGIVEVIPTSTLSTS